MKSFLKMLPLYKDIELVVETLALGDVILENNGCEKLIIERKTIRDLGASIKDGRYEEQSYRLNGLELSNHNIMYLIEGDINKINKFTDKTDKLTILSAIFSLNYYKGFSVMRTMNIEETALFICNCANKVRRGDLEDRKPHFPHPPFPPFPQVQDLAPPFPQVQDLAPPFPQVQDLAPPFSQVQDLAPPFSKVEKVDVDVENYVSVIKKVKKENITPQNIDEIMLCQIPGISSVTAVAIIDEFKTIHNLMKQMEEKGDDCLKNVTYTTTKNQTRKLNKTSIANIAKFLLKL